MNLSRPKKPRIYPDLDGEWEQKLHPTYAPESVCSQFTSYTRYHTHQRGRAAPMNPRPEPGIVTMIPTLRFPAPWSFWYDPFTPDDISQEVFVTDSLGNEIWRLVTPVRHLVTYVEALENEGISVC